MKILFVLSHIGCVRVFGTTVEELSNRGHFVHLLFSDSKNALKYEDQISKLLKNAGNRLTYSYDIPDKESNSKLLLLVRRTQNYLRFFEKRYKKAFGLRERASLNRHLKRKTILDKFITKIAISDKFIWVIISLLRIVEKSFPPNKSTLSFLERIKPDIVLVTPYVELDSPQLTWIKASKKLKIRTVYCVHSWDNLTNKGLIQIEPEAITLWNRFQAEELKMHHIYNSKIFITGAQVYDYWFESKPTKSEDEFKHELGINNFDYILYTCSSKFIAPDEVSFFSRWLKSFRLLESNKIKNTYVVIRPHPQNCQLWDGVTFDIADKVIIYPRRTPLLYDDTSSSLFYNTLYYAKCVVGINTSVMIESGILGKTVFTILDDDFKHSQDGTLHFGYIKSSGFIKTSNSICENTKQLEAFFNTEESISKENEYAKKFVKEFIRPNGIAKNCCNILCDSIESSMNLPLVKYKDSNLLFKAIFSLIVKLRNKKLFDRHKNKITEKEKKVIENHKYLKLCAESKKPLIFGPWLSEIGYEVLYWIPFIRNYCKNNLIDPKNIYIISRGGVSNWYSDFANNYFDAFEVISPNNLKREIDFKIKNCGGQKQNYLTDFEKLIVDEAKAYFKLEDAMLIHPGIMYSIFYSFWRGDFQVNQLLKLCQFNLFQSNCQIEAVVNSLPKDFIAIKFYFNNCFIESCESKTFIKNLITKLAEYNDIVVLDSGLELDDHYQADIIKNERIHYIDEKIMTPKSNLAIQALVLSKARLFIGTYGGFSYMPIFYNVPSIGIFTHDNRFLQTHCDMAARVVRSILFGKSDGIVKKDFDFARTPRGLVTMRTEQFELLLNTFGVNFSKNMIDSGE